MSTLNKVMLIGNLGKDPEVRYMPNGTCVASFSVATKESWKDKNSGEKQEKTSWHQVTCFGKIGEICAEYLKKGSKVYIEGRIQYDKWKDKESGQDKSSTKIIADKMTMLDKKETALNASRNEPEPEDEFNENQDIPF